MSILWQAGKAINKDEWKEKGLEVLLQSTKRTAYHDSLVTDAGICHGSAGIALIFRRMYLETKLDDFKSGTQYWINQTLELASLEESLGYKHSLRDSWVSDYSLLTGISGIGLVLLSYLHDEQQNWDEMLLIS
ncbi:lanthionine synthetase LanC family protein [uncultured Proteiniphilum sp.]|uniref:lanthionine synthetase LanC family protein n=1 Tax=uncultured Proteiniphilum sp. TaxID=497637 RepID=UPI002601F455|nr:lanthionine synthetase LanC family protein [uncultured Proteiniphilum sp.]